MSDERAMFVRDGEAYVGTRLTTGWWHEGAQAGGAVLALLGHVLEDVPTIEPMSLSRLTVDLIRPVPAERPLTVTRSVVREGKKIQVVDLAIECDGVVQAVARALRLRDDDVRGAEGAPVSSSEVNPVALLPGPEESLAIPDHPNSPEFLRSAVELRRTPEAVAGLWGSWIRLRIPVVAGEPVRATSRVAVPMDVVNLIGATFDPFRVSAINADVSAHVNRSPVDDWVLLAGNSWFSHGVGHGISVAQLCDRAGVFGVTSTSQLLQRRS